MKNKNVVKNLLKVLGGTKDVLSHEIGTSLKFTY